MDNKPYDGPAYRFIGKGTCIQCGNPIDWLVTPAGRKLPFDPDTTTLHMTTCPKDKKADSHE